MLGNIADTLNRFAFDTIFKIDNPNLTMKYIQTSGP